MVASCLNQHCQQTNWTRQYRQNTENGRQLWDYLVWSIELSHVGNSILDGYCLDANAYSHGFKHQHVRTLCGSGRFHLDSGAIKCLRSVTYCHGAIYLSGKGYQTVTKPSLLRRAFAMLDIRMRNLLGTHWCQGTHSY